MSRRPEELSKKIKGFSDEVITFVENISDDAWSNVCDSEQWPVGATAYHLGAGHLAIFNIAAMIVKGEELPPLSMDQINAMSNKQAHEHANCTKDEALKALKKNGAKMTAYVAGLSDEELDRRGSMPAFGGEVTTEQLIRYVIFDSAAQHFESMKTAVGK